MWEDGRLVFPSLLLNDRSPICCGSFPTVCVEEVKNSRDNMKCCDHLNLSGDFLYIKSQFKYGLLPTNPLENQAMHVIWLT